jgi:hypothetical protein
MITVFAVTLVVMLLFFAALAVRMFLVPGGEVRGTCSANSPFTARNGRCGACGKAPEEQCGRAESETPAKLPATPHT